MVDMYSFIKLSLSLLLSESSFHGDSFLITIENRWMDGSISLYNIVISYRGGCVGTRVGGGGEDCQKR
jgi:hypothetical protein